MNLTKCINGHFYDAAMYMGCPYCLQHNRTAQTLASENNAYSNNQYMQPQMPMQTQVPVQTQIPMQTQMPMQTEMPEMTQKLERPQMPKRPQMPVRPQMPKEIQPVVGWLVCIKGENYGSSFVLKAGENYIGRRSDMDVCIDKDVSVSRYRHAVVSYNPQNMEFSLLPGESKEKIILTKYQNGLPVGDSLILKDEKPLTAYDEIRVGKTTLKFVPFCGTDFTWDSVQ